jgi:ABC-type glycerol-3-phosphate transport system permease component
MERQIRTPRLSRRMRTLLKNILAYTVMTAIAFIVMLPIFWMLSTALKSRWDVLAWPPEWIPSEPQWQNFSEAMTRYPFGRFMLNTMILVGGNILGEMVSVPLIAFAFARLRFPGKRSFFILMLATMMLPSQVTMIPLYWIFSKLGMLDSYWPLILPSFFGNPFFIFLMVQYMKTIPRELDDAARIDGAGTWDILYKIILPLCVPPLTIIIVFTFLWTWNSFLDPLIYLNDFYSYPVQLGLAMFRGRFSVEWNMFMAATLITILPVLVIYFFSQNKLIGGIASVGIKG